MVRLSSCSWRRGLAVGWDLDIVSLSFSPRRARDFTSLWCQTCFLGWAYPNEHNEIQSSISQHSRYLYQSLWPHSCIIHMVILIQMLTAFFFSFFKEKWVTSSDCCSYSCQGVLAPYIWISCLLAESGISMLVDDL